MAKAQKNKRGRGRRLLSFVLFLVSAGLLFMGRHELLWGAKGYLLNRIDFLEIEGESDLPPASEARARPAEVAGVPDYEHSLRLPHEGSTLTCYRMVGFGNRLVVCSRKGLKRPEAIDEIIKERVIRGRLERLGDGPLDDRLRRMFQESGKIRLPSEGFLLTEEQAPLPSPVRLGFLALCLILCCLSAYGLIQ